MKTFEEIQLLIDKTFQEFLAHFFRLEAEKLKYYYWTSDFFEIEAGLSFSYFQLSTDQKEAINKIGQKYFDDDNVYFEINKNSHRHDMLIKNIARLFALKFRGGQSNRYEYLKEFILWEILTEISKTNKDITAKTVELQRKNFLITYLKYLLQYKQQPNFKELSDYLKFTLSNQGEAVEKQIKELEDKGIENTRLREKIDKLYVLKEEEAKLHFIFSRNQGGDKEELRELLEVMGKSETGKLYRGQANAMWTLDSSLTRESKYKEHESGMYYEILSLKPDSFHNDHTVYERLITMQHFGMPTRLMDITRNPLVAIFFACNNKERAKSDGIVYTFAKDTKEFLNFEDKKLKGLKWLFDKKYKTTKEQDAFLSSISFVRGVAKNQRINNQSGDFIFVGNGEDISLNLKKSIALSIIIDAPTKLVLLEQLESLNIHGGSVYPDLTHMSNYIRTKYLEEDKLASKYFTIEIDLSESKSKPSKIKLKVPTEETIEKEVVQLTKKYDFETFWINSKSEKLDVFARKIKINEKDLKPLIEDYLEDDKIPERKFVGELMTPKAKLTELRTKVQPVIDQMIKFAIGIK